MTTPPISESLALTISIRPVVTSNVFLFFLEEFDVTSFMGWKAWKSNSHVTTGSTTTTLVVKENTDAVRRGRAVSSHLEVRSESFTIAFGAQVLNSIEEAEAFSSRKWSGSGKIPSFSEKTTLPPEVARSPVRLNCRSGLVELTNFFSIFPVLPIPTQRPMPWAR